MTDEAIAAAGAADRHPGGVRGGGRAAGQLVPAPPGQPGAARPAPVPHRDRVQPRALAPAERQAILDVLHAERFADLAPAEVWAILLDEGTYLGSVSTFYRLLRAAGETRERRAPGHPPGRGQARAGGHRAEPGLVLGHHQAARPGEMDLLLPLRDPGHLQPLRRRLDGRHPRVRRPGGEADRRDLREAGHQPAGS